LLDNYVTQTSILAGNINFPMAAGGDKMKASSVFALQS
jgi:hypothetical protein